MATKKTILLTSVGSGVGRSFLQALGDRRENLSIVGLNSREDENLLVCDVGLKSPQTKSDDFLPFVRNVVREYGVDLVIPCRDDDAVALSFDHDEPHSGIVMPLGNGELVRTFRDKWKSFQFAREVNLGFCDTVCTDDESANVLIDDLLIRHGYPLIAKPRFGDGSRGVTLIRTSKELQACLAIPSHVIQPFLVEPDVKWSEPDLTYGVPLFWNFAPLRQGAIQILISPDGDEHHVFSHFVTHKQGFPEIVERSDNACLDAFADQALVRLREIGWRGVLNVSLMSKNGIDWEPIEFNARFTGSTSARLLLGFDEVGLVLSRWLGVETIAETHVPDRKRVSLYMQDHFSHYYPVPKFRKSR